MRNTRKATSQVMRNFAFGAAGGESVGMCIIKTRLHACDIDADLDLAEVAPVHADRACRDFGYAEDDSESSARHQ